MKAFNDKEFLKTVDKSNKFVRQFMNGKVDKSKALYKKFIATKVFKNYDSAKRLEVLEANL
jgi:hypothetical protein